MGKKRGRQTDGWARLLNSVEADDGLPTRDSGFWAKRKLWHWNRYIEITTQAMVDKPVWAAGVFYVDLFCGPGVCRIASTGERFPGSPLIAANAPKPFAKLLLCDLEKEVVQACRVRLAKRIDPNRFEVFEGNCNEQIHSIITRIPQKALTVAFLDPTGLHLHMQTVQKLSDCGAVDLLILFPDAVDALRNEKVYFAQPDSNLDRVFGEGSNWRARSQAIGNASGQKRRELYTEIYLDQLKRLAGYPFQDMISIKGPTGPLYRLVYASKHELGLKFWRESVRKDIIGQTSLFE